MKNEAKDQNRSDKRVWYFRTFWHFYNVWKVLNLCIWSLYNTGITPLTWIWLLFIFNRAVQLLSLWRPHQQGAAHHMGCTRCSVWTLPPPLPPLCHTLVQVPLPTLLLHHMGVIPPYIALIFPSTPGIAPDSPLTPYTATLGLEQGQEVAAGRGRGSLETPAAIAVKAMRQQWPGEILGASR